MKKILYVTYHFPPMNGSTSVMNYQIVNNLAENYKVYVLTVEAFQQDNDNLLLEKLNTNVSIIRTELGALHKKYYKYNEEKTSNKSSGIKKYKRVIKKILSNLKEQVLIPDPVIDWYPVALNCIKSEIEDIMPDYIISSATPYTSHLIGFRISKMYDIPLILYYGDPWVYEQSRKRGFLRFHFEKNLEKKILKHAIKVFVVTETTRQLYLEKYRIAVSKIDVTSSGFDPTDYEHNKNHSNSKLTMIYGGALNPVHRNPLPFFEALTTLSDDVKEDCHFKLYTNESEKYLKIVNEKGLNKIVDVKQIIPYETFINELESRDLLILFGNSSSLQVPGKVYDYIGSLTKILLINNTKDYTNDPTFQLLTSYDGNYHSENEPEEIKKVLNNIHNHWKQNELGKIEFKNIKQFTWENTLIKLTKYIEQN